MTLQTSGAITLAQIQTEFGGSNPISINEYYAGGTYVASGTSGTNGAVPSSGQISFSQFYGTSDAATFTPDGSTNVNFPVALDNTGAGGGAVTVTISCSAPADWTVTRSGTSTGANYPTGTYTGLSSITFSLTNNDPVIRSTSWTVTGVSGTTTRYWTVDITNEGTA